MELLTSPWVDDLSVLLEQINIRSAVYCISELRAPWGFRVDGSAVAKFHLVLDGEAVLTLDEPGTAAATVSVGELVLLARGSAHLVQDRHDSATPPLEHILAEQTSDGAPRLAYGGGGSLTSLLCGGFALAPGLTDELLRLLPPLLVLDARSTGITRWLEPVYALPRDEIASDAPGATAILAKIADVFLTQILRAYLSGLEATTTPITPAAAADPAVGTTLALLRLQPGAPWTVADLARKVDMSRTSFAARFRDLVGEPPMTYLTRLRLGHAAGYLVATDKTLQQIARLVGYDNEASLSKAFRRTFGQAPGEYRRQRLAGPVVRATLDTSPAQRHDDLNRTAAAR